MLPKPDEVEKQIAEQFEQCYATHTSETENRKRLKTQLKAGEMDAEGYRRELRRSIARADRELRKLQDLLALLVVACGTTQRESIRMV